MSNQAKPEEVSHEMIDAALNAFYSQVKFGDYSPANRENMRRAIDAARAAEPSRAETIEEAAKAARATLEGVASYFKRTRGHWDRDDQARSYVVAADEVEKAIRALTTGSNPT